MGNLKKFDLKELELPCNTGDGMALTLTNTSDTNELNASIECEGQRIEVMLNADSEVKLSDYLYTRLQVKIHNEQAVIVGQPWSKAAIDVLGAVKKMELLPDVKVIKGCSIGKTECLVIYNEASVAAIAYALNCDDEGLEFLRLWNEGEFQSLRDEWEDVPDEVFIGADPLFKKENK